MVTKQQFSLCIFFHKLSFLGWNLSVKAQILLGHITPNYRRNVKINSKIPMHHSLKAKQLQEVHKLPMMTMTHHGQIKFFIHLNKWSEESMVRRECHKIIIIKIQTRNPWNVWKKYFFWGKKKPCWFLLLFGLHKTYEHVLYCGCAKARLLTHSLVVPHFHPPFQPTAPLMRAFPLRDRKQHPPQKKKKKKTNNNKCLAKAI